jgi:hypothetical protein
MPLYIFMLVSKITTYVCKEKNIPVSSNKPSTARKPFLTIGRTYSLRPCIHVGTYSLFGHLTLFKTRWLGFFLQNRIETLS